MGGVALRWCGFGGGRSKIATAIAPITASRDKRVDHRAAADEIRRPLGNSWLADAFNRVPRDIAMARFPAPGRVLLRLSQNTGPPVRFPSRRTSDLCDGVITDLKKRPRVGVAGSRSSLERARVAIWSRVPGGPAGIRWEM
jgi:hypothetical protein